MNQAPPRISTWKQGTVEGNVIAIEDVFVVIGKDDKGNLQFSKEPIERKMYTKEMILAQKEELNKQYAQMIGFWDKGLDLFDNKTKTKLKKK